jgi:hypothetical protein
MGGSRKILPWLGAAVLAACGGRHPVNGPTPAEAQKPPEHVLNTMILAGQKIPVLPITMVVAAPELANDSAYGQLRSHRTSLLWADTIIGEGLQTHASEVNWILPPELRKVARRSPGIVPDPDQMGQSVMRSPKLDRAPGQLAAGLRGLIAVAGGRNVLIPAALGLARADSTRVRADLSLVLLDGRGNQVLWRAVADGEGTTPAEALAAAVASALPTGVSP